MSDTTRPAAFDRHTTYIVIDLDCIAQNVRAIREHIGTGPQFIAVVKDDAYGHGALQVSRVALDNGADRLAVARTEEGILLRRAGLQAPILHMCYTVPAEADEIAENRLIATVIDRETAGALSAAAERLGRSASVHVKVDTGMGRYGLLPEEVLPFLEVLRSLPHLEVEGIYTHYATADAEDKSYTLRQLAIFNDVLQAAQAAGWEFRLRHSANSGATLDLPETYLDAVRPGLIVYGLYPSEAVSRTVKLSPALSLRSHVGRVRALPPGAGISYGLTFTTQRESAIALVPVGYGDGYQRILSNRGSVLIGGRRAPIAGRICMDQFMVDVTDLPGVQEGDEIVLIGRQGDEAISAEEVAALCHTINYEIVTGLARRIPRVYLQGNKVVEVIRSV